jgi:hypothetical protein
MVLRLAGDATRDGTIEVFSGQTIKGKSGSAAVRTHAGILEASG